MHVGRESVSGPGISESRGIVPRAPALLACAISASFIARNYRLRGGQGWVRVRGIEGLIVMCGVSRTFKLV